MHQVHLLKNNHADPRCNQDAKRKREVYPLKKFKKACRAQALFGSPAYHLQVIAASREELAQNHGPRIVTLVDAFFERRRFALRLHHHRLAEAAEAEHQVLILVAPDAPTHQVEPDAPDAPDAPSRA